MRSFAFFAVALVFGSLCVLCGFALDFSFGFSASPWWIWFWLWLRRAVIKGLALGDYQRFSA